MFEGEKTSVFWTGLIILSLASTALFSIIWYTMVTSPFFYATEYWRYLTPPIVVAVVFILIGLYMMKSGIKKQKEREIQLLKQQ